MFGDADDDVFTAYHHQLDANVILVALGSSGGVGVLDTREGNGAFARVLQTYSFRTSVKTVDVHPFKKEVLLCSNSKGGCHTFDLRAKKIEPLSEFLGHTKAISSAFFSPLAGAHVNTVCYDNKIRLFDSSASGDVPPSVSVEHDNQTGRWLTTFKAEWHPRRDDLFFVGSMRQPRRIEAFSTPGRLVAELGDGGEHLASVCSIVKCHPTLDMVVGGNSSGRVHVFK